VAVEAVEEGVVLVVLQLSQAALEELEEFGSMLLNAIL
jgi:hypothetical protein